MKTRFKRAFVSAVLRVIRVKAQVGLQDYNLCYKFGL
jgi:hypothetical protein